MCEDIREAGSRMKYSKQVLWTVLGFGEERYPKGKRYSINYKNKPHKDILVLHYSLEGQIILQTPKKKQTVPEGHLLICRHGDACSCEKEKINSDYSCLWVTLCGAGLADHFHALRLQHGFVLNIGKDHPILLGIRRLCELTNPKEPADPLVMAGAIHRLTVSLYAHAEFGFCGQLSPVNLAIHRLVSSPLHAWNIKELAAKCGCSREHFSREFSARYNQSPQEYLMRCRSDRAIYLLKHTALPVTSIIAQTGFPNSTSLARCVRDLTGKTPQQLRPSASHIPRGQFRGLFDESQLS